MTSELQRKRGYAIPDPVDGYTDFVCYQVYVPDVLEYRLAFEAQVQGLDRWWMWEKDGDKEAKRAARAARYWYALTKELTANNCEADMFDIRQKPDALCTIQKTFNAGGLWIDAVNMQLCPPRIRTNNGIIEWYNPDTDSWLPVDGGDERTDGSAPIPWPDPPVGENGACLAAENITAVYQSMLTEVRAGVVEGKTVTIVGSLITSVASLFIPAAIFATGALLMSAAAFTLGEVGLDIMLLQEHLDNFKCQVYMNAESDGSITASGFTAIRAGMATWASGLELEFIEQYLDGYGSVGLQRQGRAGGITTGDCEGCYDIYIGYINGSGDTAVVSGGTIECAVSLTSSPFYTLSFTTSVCVEIELVALTGWTSPVGVDGNMWAGYVKECGDTGFHAGYTDPFTYVWDNEEGFDISSLSAGCTATLRLTVV